MKPHQVKEKIYRAYNHFSLTQRRIADFMINNTHNVALMTIEDIAAQTNTSLASIVRFAKLLGYDGFSGFRAEITASLQSEIAKPYSFPLNNNIQDDVMTAIANQEIQNINQTIQMNSRAKFSMIVEIILTSQRVNTAGLGLSYLLSQLLSYQLHQIGIAAQYFRQGTTTFLEQLLYTQPKDCLICFSFPPYSPETLILAEEASRQSIKVIAITDHKIAPICSFALESLFIESANMLYTNSMAAISVIINSLTTECARRNESKSLTIMQKIRELSGQPSIIPNNPNQTPQEAL